MTEDEKAKRAQYIEHLGRDWFFKGGPPVPRLDPHMIVIMLDRVKSFTQNRTLY